MGEFTTSSRPTTTSFAVTKYVLLLFIVLNILSTIWVGIYNHNMVDYMKWNFPDDRWTHDRAQGHAAELWEKLCITFLVFENIFNMVGLVAACQEHYCLAVGYSALMFVCALYGSAAKYVRGSVCSYLMPLLVAIIASVFAHMIRMDNYEATTQTQADSQSDIEANKSFKEEPIYTAPKKKMSPNTRAKHLSNPLIADYDAMAKENGIEMNGYKTLNGVNGKTTYL